MGIREKILFLLRQNKVSQAEMAKLQGMTPGNLSQILAGKQGISLDFILTLKKEFPTLDFNTLLDDDMDASNISAVAEEKPNYTKQLTPKSALLEIKKILEKTQI